MKTHVRFSLTKLYKALEDLGHKPEKPGTFLLGTVAGQDQYMIMFRSGVRAQKSTRIWLPAEALHNALIEQGVFKKVEGWPVKADHVVVLTVAPDDFNVYALLESTASV